jgi:hypothetical protein
MSSSKLLLIACLVSTLLYCRPLRAENGNHEIVILGNDHVETQAILIRQFYPEVKKNLEDTLGWKLRWPPRIVLSADREVFEQMSGSTLVSAFAVPREHALVMYLSPATSDPYVLHETLEHELCHLLLHDHISRTRLPKWLDEGICQWISGSLGEIFAGKGFVSSGISLSRHPIPLEQLTESFPGDKHALLQAYEESRLFVDFLVARYGKEGLLRLLERLKAGEPTEEALLGTFSKSLETLEKEWLHELHGRSVWLLWVSQYLYEILFFAGALLTVLAFVRVMIRKKRYDPDEEDEK